MRYLLTVCALALVACGDSTGPTSHALRVGRYSYSAYGGSIAGTLRITYATADSVAGAWDVRSPDGQAFYEPPVSLGFWNQDAYVLYAKGAQAAAVTYTHRVWRDGEATACTAKIAAGASFACVVAYLGP